MPTPRLVYLSSRKQASEEKAALNKKIYEYLSQLTSGYFYDINIINWNQFYLKDVPIAFSKILMQYRLLPVALEKHISDIRSPDFYELYSHALEYLENKASNYSNIFAVVAQHLQEDLKSVSMSSAAAQFASLYIRHLSPEIDNNFFRSLWSSMNYSTNACAGLAMICDSVEFSQNVSFNDFYLIKTQIVHSEPQIHAIVELIGTICYRKDDLSAMFESGCFSIVCGFLDFGNYNLLNDVLWIISNLARAYHYFFGPAVLEIVRKGLQSTYMQVVEYCCIILEEFSYSYDDITADFIQDSGILDNLGDVLIRNGNNSRIVEHLLVFIHQMIRNRVIRGAEEYYDAIAVVYDMNTLNQQIVSDFLIQLN